MAPGVPGQEGRDPPELGSSHLLGVTGSRVGAAAGAEQGNGAERTGCEVPASRRGSDGPCGFRDATARILHGEKKIFFVAKFFSLVGFFIIFYLRGCFLLKCQNLQVWQ